MSWLYSQVLVEEYLGDISSDGEQSAQSSGNPTQQAYCSPDKMTECSRLSQFGMMFKPLMEDLGEELLMSYLAAFHAKTSPQQAREQGSTESGQECGEKWQGSFTKYDPDSSLWKTHQCSLLGGLESFSETWPRWGLMRDGECWERQMSEQTIRGTESGLSLNPHLPRWPTPVTSDASGAGRVGPRKSGNISSLKDYLSKWHRLAYPPVNITEYMMGWPLGWTDLKPLETDKFQKWLDEHGRN